MEISRWMGSVWVSFFCLILDGFLELECFFKVVLVVLQCFWSFMVVWSFF